MDRETILIIIIILLIITCCSKKKKICTEHKNINNKDNNNEHKKINSNFNNKYKLDRDAIFNKLMKKNLNKSEYQDIKTNLLSGDKTDKNGNIIDINNTNRSYFNGDADIKNDTNLTYDEEPSSDNQNKDMSQHIQYLTKQNSIILYKNINFKGQRLYVPVGNSILISEQNTNGDIFTHHKSLEFPKGNYIIIISKSYKDTKKRFYILHKSIYNLEEFLTLNNIISFDNPNEPWLHYIKIANQQQFNEEKKENKLNYISSKNNCINQNRAFGLNMSNINDVCDLQL